MVAGYCICNDVSERDFQIERGGQWTKGKGSETFGPLGPWLVTKDEIKNVQKLDMWLDVNGEKRQRGNTKTMIFGIAHIVWYCSQFFVLEPGDVITTGTPPGVGARHEAGRSSLKAGDVVTLGIEGLGEQQQKIVGSRCEHRALRKPRSAVAARSRGHCTVFNAGDRLPASSVEGSDRITSTPDNARAAPAWRASS